MANRISLSKTFWQVSRGITAGQMSDVLIALRKEDILTEMEHDKCKNIRKIDYQLCELLSILINKDEHESSVILGSFSDITVVQGKKINYFK